MASVPQTYGNLPDRWVETKPFIVAQRRKHENHFRSFCQISTLPEAPVDNGRKFIFWDRLLGFQFPMGTLTITIQSLKSTVGVPMVVVDDDYSDPVGVVLIQDACMSEAGIDFARWTKTVFLPLTMSSDGNLFTVEDEPGFHDHLSMLSKKALDLGVTKLRTRVLSHIQPSDEMAIVSSIRDRMAGDGKIIGSSSITWTLMSLNGAWKINQILFNDAVYDPSVVAQVFLGRPNKEKLEQYPETPTY